MRLCSEWESDWHNCKKDCLLFPTWWGFFPHWEFFPILKVCIITAGSRGATWMRVVSFLTSSHCCTIESTERSKTPALIWNWHWSTFEYEFLRCGSPYLLPDSWNFLLFLADCWNSTVTAAGWSLCRYSLWNPAALNILIPIRWQ